MRSFVAVVVVAWCVVLLLGAAVVCSLSFVVRCVLCVGCCAMCPVSC